MSKSHRTIVGRFALAAGVPETPAPEGWRWVPLAEVARLESGHTPSRRHPEYWDGEIPWIGIADARENNKGYIHDTSQHVTEAGLENSSARLLPANTVCLSRTASVGYCVIMARPMATSQDFVDWICGPELDPEFLMWLFLAEGDEGLKRFGKGTTHTTIYFTEVKRFHVCIPDIDTQRAIVQRINRQRDRVLAAQAALSPTPELIEKFRQSVLAAAFRGDLTKEWREQNPDVEPASVLLQRIRAERRERWIEDAAEKGRAKVEAKARKAGKPWTREDDEKVLAKERVKAAKKYKQPEPVDPTGLPELPETWCWARWGEVGFCQNGRAFPSKHYSDSGVRLLRPGNLHASGRIEWTEKNTRYLPNEFAIEHAGHVIGPNELVVNLTAQSLKDEFLGRTCLTGDDEYCLLNQRIARIAPVSLSPKFCLWLFKSRVFRSYVDSGLNTGSLIQHMYTSQIDEFVFPLPPQTEHTAMVKAVEEIIVRKEVVEAAVESARTRLQRVEQSVLAIAFSTQSGA